MSCSSRVFGPRRFGLDVETRRTSGTPENHGFVMDTSDPLCIIVKMVQEDKGAAEWNKTVAPSQRRRLKLFAWLGESRCHKIMTRLDDQCRTLHWKKSKQKSCKCQCASAPCDVACFQDPRLRSGGGGERCQQSYENGQSRSSRRNPFH